MYCGAHRLRHSSDPSQTELNESGFLPGSGCECSVHGAPGLTGVPCKAARPWVRSTLYSATGSGRLRVRSTIDSDTAKEVLERRRDSVHIIHRWILALLCLEIMVPKEDLSSIGIEKSQQVQVASLVISDGEEAGRNASLIGFYYVRQLTIGACRIRHSKDFSNSTKFAANHGIELKEAGAIPLAEELSIVGGQRRYFPL